MQVSVKKGAAVVGKNIRDIGFRGRFNAAVIAVKRSKVRQPGRLGDLVLQEKDVLVISTGSLFNPTNEDFAANFEK
jgi:K+/H+ antiporter YhaU regulatory subunit KhtT